MSVNDKTHSEWLCIELVKIILLIFIWFIGCAIGSVLFPLFPDFHWAMFYGFIIGSIATFCKELIK